MKGILDRIEDCRYAIILVEEEKIELVLPVNQLPEGSQLHSWFIIDTENGQLALTLDEETSNKKARETEKIMARLRMKKKKSRFKRN